jgi:hypothetical protein
MGHPIEPGGTREKGFTGKLFDTSIDGETVLKGGRYLNRVPRGLAIRVQGGVATMELQVGEPYGGAENGRIWTLTRRGAWFEVGGWTIVRLYVRGISSDQVEVGWAWTTIPPSVPPLLQLVQTISSAVDTEIPEGARELALSLADPAWVWKTDPDGTGDLVMNAPQPGAGASRDVQGARYLASVAGNVATWTLYPL